MPTYPSCPKCGDPKRVTVEHVIQGGRSYRSFHCGACGHQWQSAERPEHVPTTGDKPPDRSR